MKTKQIIRDGLAFCLSERAEVDGFLRFFVLQDCNSGSFGFGNSPVLMAVVA